MQSFEVQISLDNGRDWRTGEKRDHGFLTELKLEKTWNLTSRAGLRVTCELQTKTP